MKIRIFGFSRFTLHGGAVICPPSADIFLKTICAAETDSIASLICHVKPTLSPTLPHKNYYIKAVILTPGCTTDKHFFIS